MLGTTHRCWLPSGIGLGGGIRLFGSSWAENASAMRACLWRGHDRDHGNSGERPRRFAPEECKGALSKVGEVRRYVIKDHWIGRDRREPATFQELQLGVLHLLCVRYGPVPYPLRDPRYHVCQYSIIAPCVGPRGPSIPPGSGSFHRGRNEPPSHIGCCGHGLS